MVLALRGHLRAKTAVSTAAKQFSPPPSTLVTPNHPKGDPLVCPGNTPEGHFKISILKCFLHAPQTLVDFLPAVLKNCVFLPAAQQSTIYFALLNHPPNFINHPPNFSPKKCVCHPSSVFLNHSKELRVGLLGSSGRFPVCLSVHFCAGTAMLY